MAKHKPTNLPDDLSELLALPEPALSTTDLVAVREAVTLPPEEFQKALTPVYQRLMVDGLAKVPAPQSLKELATVQKLFRESAGLDAKDKGGGPVGLVAFMRPVGRRSLDVEAVAVEVEGNEFGI